jgi:hypothetical protein
MHWRRVTPIEVQHGQLHAPQIEALSDGQVSPVHCCSSLRRELVIKRELCRCHLLDTCTMPPGRIIPGMHTLRYTSALHITTVSESAASSVQVP